MDLKELLDDILFIIKTEVSDFSNLDQMNVADKVKEYNGEYDGGDWTPVFPTCFVELVSSQPDVYNNSLRAVHSITGFKLYVGNIKTNDVHVLTTVGNIIEALNLKSVEVDGITYKFQIGRIALVGKTNELKVYSIDVNTL